MTGVESAKPHIRKTERAEPRAETRITLVGCRWSVREPIRIVPTTEDRLRTETRRAECREDSFSKLEAKANGPKVSLHFL